MGGLTVLFVALGVLNALYGCTVLATGSGTAFFAVWFLLALAFFGLAIGTHLGVWDKVPALVRRGFLVVLGAAFALFIAVEGLIMTQFGAHGEPDLDYIVVLGAQVREDGPSVVLAHRLNTAYTYLAENEATVCIVAGGQGYNEPWPEAEGMANYLIGRGIDPERIVLEDQSTNTVENIGNSMAFIEPGSSVGIVTNNFHVFRSVQIAQKLGLEDACGIAAPSNPWYLPNNLLREFLGVCKDFLARNI